MHRQGVHRVAAGVLRLRGNGEGASGLRESANRPVQVSAQHRVRAGAATYRDGKASALSTARRASVRSHGTAPMKIVQPAGWPRPSGYANAVVASGRVVVVSGQIGWNPATEKFETDDMAAQVRQALDNLVVVLHAAGADARHVARLTWYVTDRAVYLASRREIGEIYRALFGDHYPAMSVIVVAGLLDPRAKVEIEATAILPPERS